MSFYNSGKAIEDEVITLIKDHDSEAARSIPAGHIKGGLRTLTQYVNVGGFPWIEVTWTEATWERGGTQTVEVEWMVEVTCLYKSSDPFKGVEGAKALAGMVYDALWDKPQLDCAADILPRGTVVLMPPALVGQTNWVYAAVATFFYHKRL